MGKFTVRYAAAAVGAAFLLVGVLGFIPGITSHVDSLDLTGPGLHTKLLGLFAVSTLHNLVHVVFGLAGLTAYTQSDVASRAYLLVGGVIYLALTVYGWAIDRTSDANFVPVNVADNWLHLALGVLMVGLGLAFIRERVTDPTTY